MAATDQLKKSRAIHFNIVLDAKALMEALGEKKKDGEDDDEEEKEGAAVRVLKQRREEEKTPIVKLSQTPMAG